VWTIGVAVAGPDGRSEGADEAVDEDDGDAEREGAADRLRDGETDGAGETLAEGLALAVAGRVVFGVGAAADRLTSTAAP